MYVYIYDMYTYICIYIYKYMYMYIYICIYICIYIYVCIWVYLSIYIYIHTYNIYIYILYFPRWIFRFTSPGLHGVGSCLRRHRAPEHFEAAPWRRPGSKQKNERIGFHGFQKWRVQQTCVKQQKMIKMVKGWYVMFFSSTNQGNANPQSYWLNLIDTLSRTGCWSSQGNILTVDLKMRYTLSYAQFYREKSWSIMKFGSSPISDPYWNMKKPFKTPACAEAQVPHHPHWLVVWAFK